MLQAEIQRSVRRASLLLASSLLVLAGCALQAQPAQTSKQTAPEPTPSLPTDSAKVKQDEVRLLAILAKNPEDPGALAGMGWVRSRQKNYTAAISYLERAKQKRPNDPGLNVALEEARFHVLLAEGHNALTANDLDSAQAFYSRALIIRPHSREALDGLHATLQRARLSRHPVLSQTENAGGS
jgi:tetratricopeptide (TPR) repeat protein